MGIRTQFGSVRWRPFQNNNFASRQIRFQKYVRGWADVFQMPNFNKYPDVVRKATFATLRQ